MVLVVDDDVTACALAQAYLQLEGYRVKTAVNGVDALVLLQDCVPCAMVVDLRMPRMDGVELRRQQLTMAAVANVPFILMSASAELQETAEMLSASDVLVKPFDHEELKAAIEHACSAGPP